MSIATKCTCGSNPYYCDGLTEKCNNRLNTTVQNLTINKEAFGIIYVLETLLDFAGEAKKDSISISTTDAIKIIKLLKQIR